MHLHATCGRNLTWKNKKLIFMLTYIQFGHELVKGLLSFNCHNNNEYRNFETELQISRTQIIMRQQQQSNNATFSAKQQEFVMKEGEELESERGRKDKS